MNWEIFNGTLKDLTCSVLIQTLLGTFNVKLNFHSHHFITTLSDSSRNVLLNSDLISGNFLSFETLIITEVGYIWKDTRTLLIYELQLWKYNNIRKLVHSREFPITLFHAKRSKWMRKMKFCILWDSIWVKYGRRECEEISLVFEAIKLDAKFSTSFPRKLVALATSCLIVECGRGADKVVKQI